MKVNQLFVNLPVRHVAQAQAFYAALGAEVQPAFTNEQAACMKLNEQLFVMLLDHAFFGTFTPLPIADAHASTQMLLAIDQGSRAEVDAFVQTACEAGATEPRPVQDLGFMYSRAFADLDGHIWEVFWMNAQTPPPQEH
jgi:predicted lactoylglutathione lyase